MSGYEDGAAGPSRNGPLVLELSANYQPPKKKKRMKHGDSRVITLSCLFNAHMAAKIRSIPSLLILVLEEMRILSFSLFSIH